MNAARRSTLAIFGLLVLTQLGHAQIGATREELVKRYGPCEQNPARNQKGPNVYDGVIDVGEDCTFSEGQLRFNVLFRSDRAVGFTYTKQPTFWGSLLHPFGYPDLPFSDPEISALLHSAIPNAEWIPGAGDSVVRHWRTSDSSAAAYYFAGGHWEVHHLVVQKAAVDEIYQRVRKIDLMSKGT